MKTLYKSLAEFQQQVGTINKDSKGYGYKYASLENIVKHINPLLKKNKLGFTQLINGDTIKTVLFHTESEETIESNTTIPNDVVLKGQNAFQVLGSAISYLRRYSLVALLGIVTDEDTDTQEIKQAPRKPDFTEQQFTAAKKANATIQSIKTKYNVSKDIEAKYLEYVTKK